MPDPAGVPNGASPWHPSRTLRDLSALGAGGMGEVYRAKDTRLGREVAIKMLPAEMVASIPSGCARFEREASRLRAQPSAHRHALRSRHERGGPYLVLEKIEGQSLRQLLTPGRCRCERVLALGAQIADGPREGARRRHRPPRSQARQRHGDGDGFAKILDFGLAKLVLPELARGSADENDDAGARHRVGHDPRHARLSVARAGGGQAGGRPGGPVCARRAALRDGDAASGCSGARRCANRWQRRFARSRAPLRSKRAEVPPQLAWIVERCLAKDPNDRYASTKDLARDLADSAIGCRTLRRRSRRAPRWRARDVCGRAG